MPISNGGSPHLDKVGASAERWVFRLYVSSASPISSRAIVNVRKLLESRLSGCYELDILNISDHVAQAREDQIVASPTLVRVSPLPLRRLIGDMTDERKCVSALGLPASVEGK